MPEIIAFGDILTTTEAMQYLKISRKTLLKLVHRGEVPARKVGKDFRYLRTQLNNFLMGKTEVNYFRT